MRLPETRVRGSRDLRRPCLRARRAASPQSHQGNPRCVRPAHGGSTCFSQGANGAVAKGGEGLGADIDDPRFANWRAFNEPTQADIEAGNAVVTDAGVLWTGRAETPAVDPVMVGVGGVVGRGAAAVDAGAPTLWPAASGGRQVIGGIEYTVHALGRMAPVGLGGRGIPPSVVENAIRFGATAPGAEAGTVVHMFQNVTAVTNAAGTRVITVIRTGF